MDNLQLPTVEEHPISGWLIDGVFVDIKDLRSLGDRDAMGLFWIGIDNTMQVNENLVQVVNQIIGDDEELGITLAGTIVYIDPENVIGFGLEHPGLVFKWIWTFTEEQTSGPNDNEIENLVVLMALYVIAGLIALLRSNNIPLSEQHPYSSKNIWFNHFRPLIDNLMSLGQAYWLPALSMTIPCIDAAYQDARNIKKLSNAKRMLHWFFDPDSSRREDKMLKKAIDLLADGLVNGLKHDAIVRGSIVLDNRNFQNIFSEPVFSEYFDAQRTIRIFALCSDYKNNEKLVVSPIAWWTAVREKLNQHYNLSS